MSRESFWSTGEHVTFRGLGNNQVFWTYPTIVVQDTPDLIALYLPAGVLGKNIDHRLTPKEISSNTEINVVDHQWVKTDVLMLIVPEESFSTYLMWKTGTKELDCWYVNLQDPISRTSIGFDTTDHWLDVVISPDMSEWNWKDEDEFAQAENVGLYSAEKANEIRTQGEKAVQLITQERRELYKKWEMWQANPEWALPQLSPHWQKLNLD